MIGNLKLLLLMLLFSCLVAGLYGVLHNQISYTVAPEYFTVFKFNQFGISPDIDRLGAAYVGFLASWWMGLIIGIPIALAALFTPNESDCRYIFMRVALLISAIALLCGIGALIYAHIFFTPDNLPYWSNFEGVKDKAAFARAGMMHNFSYIGGGVGLIIGFAVTILNVRRARQNSNQQSNDTLLGEKP